MLIPPLACEMVSYSDPTLPESQEGTAQGGHWLLVNNNAILPSLDMSKWLLLNALLSFLLPWKRKRKHLLVFSFCTHWCACVQEHPDFRDSQPNQPRPVDAVVSTLMYLIINPFVPRLSGKHYREFPCNLSCKEDHLEMWFGGILPFWQEFVPVWCLMIPALTNLACFCVIHGTSVTFPIAGHAFN